MKFELLLVIVALYLLNQLLEVDVFCILVDELLLCAFKITCQFEFLLGCLNFMEFAPLVVFL